MATLIIALDSNQKCAGLVHQVFNVLSENGGRQIEDELKQKPFVRVKWSRPVMVKTYDIPWATDDKKVDRLQTTLDGMTQKFDAVLAGYEIQLPHQRPVKWTNLSDSWRGQRKYTAEIKHA